MLDIGENVSMTKNDVMVSLVNIGEGLCGDYYPYNKNDINLLRLDVNVLEGYEWEPVDNGSTCTQIAADIQEDKLYDCLRYLLNQMYLILHNNHEASIKNAIETLSYIDG